MKRQLSVIYALSFTGLVLVLPWAYPDLSIAAPAVPVATGSGKSIETNETKQHKEVDHKFKEGTHYEVLEEFEASDKPVVTEMFSIYCAGCYRWEQESIAKLAENLRKRKISFKQGHLYRMGSYGKKITTALAITQGTDLYQPVKNALFKKIHVKGEGDWKNDDDFFSTLESAGMSRKAFEQQQNGPVTLKTVVDWNRYVGYIPAVPSFVVNNRFLIITNSLKTIDELMELIEWLVKSQNKTETKYPTEKVIKK